MGGEEDGRRGRRGSKIIYRGLTTQALHLAVLSEMSDWSVTPNELAVRMRKDRREVRAVFSRLAKAGWVRKKRGEIYATARDRLQEDAAERLTADEVLGALEGDLPEEG